MVKMTEEPDDYEGPWPEGGAMTEWVMVPREPTEKMIRAGGHVNSEWLNDNAPINEGRYCSPMGGAYRAMLEAAPAAPQQAEPHGEIARPWCHYSMLPDHVCNKCGRVHGYSNPQQGEVARLREALHQISLCSQNSMSSKDECGRIARKALEGGA